MTSGQRRSRGMFVPLQANYYLDAAIRAVGPRGELAFLRSLAIAKLCDRDGYLLWSQCDDVKRDLRHWARTRDALAEHKLWVPAPDGSGFRIRSWSDHNESRVDREVANAQDAARKRAVRRRPETTTTIDVSGRTPRVESREEKREVGTERTPSGSVRSVPPAAAQRGTGGAAQHPAAAEVRSLLADRAPARRAKLNKPPTVDNGRREHVDFSATLAKLTEAAEKLNGSNPGDAE